MDAGACVGQTPATMRTVLLITLSFLVPDCLCDLLRDTHVTSAAARPNNELWCYKCHADVPEDECANLRQNSSTLIHKCHNDRRVCMRPINELWCYKCHADVPEDECANLRQNSSTLIHKCHNDRRVCMVKRFSFTTSTENSTTALKMWALERNCTKHCEPGCIVIGERTKLYACTSCCTESLCNYGSGTVRVVANILSLIIALTVVL